MKTESVNVKTTKPWFKPENSPRWVRVVEHYIRTKIFRQKRYLIDNWTVEEMQNIEAIHGIDIEQELYDILKEEINKEMITEHGPDWQQRCDEEIIKHLKQFQQENNNE